METVLMIVTVIALALAIAMAVLAWRLLRENRQRSAARAEALQELAAGDADVSDALSAGPSTLLGASERFAMLEPEAEFDPREDIRRERRAEPDTDWDFALAESHDVRAQAARPRAARAHAARAPLPDAMFGASAAPPRAPRSRWLALCAVGVVMAALASAVYTFYLPVIAAESPAGAPAALDRGAEPRPLELLSLRHTADPGGTFSITGLVQNPNNGATVRNVMAVVYLFDRDGKYFASGKAALEFNVLQGGAESPFVVRVPNATYVSRYRVGFRTDTDGVVAHVDRRGQAPDGTTEDR
jgi:hypothetical protein